MILELMCVKCTIRSTEYIVTPSVCKEPVQKFHFMELKEPAKQTSPTHAWLNIYSTTGCHQLWVLVLTFDHGKCLLVYYLLGQFAKLKMKSIFHEKCASLIASVPYM